MPVLYFDRCQAGLFWRTTAEQATGIRATRHTYPVDDPLQVVTTGRLTSAIRNLAGFLSVYKLALYNRTKTKLVNPFMPDGLSSESDAEPSALSDSSTLCLTDYQQLLGLVAQAVWETDGNGQVLVDSPSWRTYTGQSVEAWLGEGWVGAVHPDDQANAQEQWQAAVDRRHPVNAEFRLRSPDGGWRWTNVKAMPVPGEKGSIRKWLGINIDISDKKRSQEALVHNQHRNARELEMALRERTTQLQVNRQLLQATLDASQDLIQVFEAVRDEQGDIIDFTWRLNNHAAEQYYGDVIGKSLLNENPGVGSTGIFDTFRQVVQTGQSNQSERHYVYEQFAGWFYQSVVKLDDGVATTTADITARKQVEERLQESELQFRRLANALPQAIWVTDTEGRAEFMNQWWVDYSGIPFTPITAWQVAQDSLHPEDAPRLVAAFREAMQQGKGFEVEQRNRSASGEYRWFLNRGEPYRDPQTGQITKWVGLSVDIHDRKLAEHLRQESEGRYRALSMELESQVQQRTQELDQTNQGLAASNAELAEANRLLVRSNDNLQTFAYVASHDLQEPLRKIQQFGDLLKVRYADSVSDELVYIDRMQSAAKRMSILIKDLLDFSRISTQREVGDPVSLDEVVRQVVSTLELSIQDTGAQLDVAPLPTVMGDGSQLNQLFQNLLSNALKFRQPGVVPHITVSAHRLAAEHLPQGLQPGRVTPAYHRIDVADNGIGFEEKYLDRIFQVFQRLHGKSEFAGTGIGLAVVQKVVTNHGGAITATSRPGEGATFRVYLPG